MYSQTRRQNKNEADGDFDFADVFKTGDTPPRKPKRKDKYEERRDAQYFMDQRTSQEKEDHERNEKEFQLRFPIGKPVRKSNTGYPQGASPKTKHLQSLSREFQEDSMRLREKKKRIENVKNFLPDLYRNRKGQLDHAELIEEEDIKKAEMLKAEQDAIYEKNKNRGVNVPPPGAFGFGGKTKRRKLNKTRNKKRKTIKKKKTKRKTIKKKKTKRKTKKRNIKK